MPSTLEYSPCNFANGTDAGSTNAPSTASEITTRLATADARNHLSEILVDAFAKERFREDQGRWAVRRECVELRLGVPGVSSVDR